MGVDFFLPMNYNSIIKTEDKQMTNNEMKLYEILREADNLESALVMAIQIFAAYAEQPAASSTLPVDDLAGSF